jgi:hypothetical protein
MLGRGHGRGFGVWISRFPALSTVAVPCSAFSVDHPKDAAFIADHQFGHFEAKAFVVQAAFVVLLAKVPEALLNLIEIHGEHHVWL